MGLIFVISYLNYLCLYTQETANNCRNCTELVKILFDIRSNPVERQATKCTKLTLKVN